ncbi:MAG TPA: hypothetical protein VF635_00130 [Propionibacteriaceae bacterium]|jgi:hypothetical protein
MTKDRIPWSASIVGACGVILVGIGLYFLFLRPPLLVEDARYVGATLEELQTIAPGIEAWLERVFWVLGGYMAATGILTAYLAATALRARAGGAAITVTLAGIISIGSMAVVNVLIDSDFKVPLVALAALWAIALVLYRLGR